MAQLDAGLLCALEEVEEQVLILAWLLAVFLRFFSFIIFLLFGLLPFILIADPF